LPCQWIPDEVDILLSMFLILLLLLLGLLLLLLGLGMVRDWLDLERSHQTGMTQSPKGLVIESSLVRQVLGSMLGLMM